MNKCKVETCNRDSHTRGWCATHYRRVMRNGNVAADIPFMGLAKTPSERIEEKSTLVPFCGCRLWFGASVPFGYGVSYFEGRQQYAHRIAWQIDRGPIPDGLLVLHECDTPSCINVNHLFLGTSLDNMKDMYSKGRSNHTNKARGQAHPFYKTPFCTYTHKITSDIAKQIRSEYEPGKIKQIDLATKYGLRQSQISSIVRGKSWA